MPHFISMTAFAVFISLCGLLNDVLEKLCQRKNGNTVSHTLYSQDRLSGVWWQSTGGKLEWTIIRPGGLKNDPPTGSGVLTQDKSICGAINREDVADLVVKALFSDKANGKVSDDQAPTKRHHLCQLSRLSGFFLV